MAMVDPCNQRVLPLRLARQGFLQHLDDIARRQQCQARLVSHTLLGDEQLVVAAPEKLAALWQKCPFVDDVLTLDEAVKEFMKQQQRILDQTASLAKKPVDDFDDNDKKKEDEGDGE